MATSLNIPHACLPLVVRMIFFTLYTGTLGKLVFNQLSIFGQDSFSNFFSCSSILILYSSLLLSSSPFTSSSKVRTNPLTSLDFLLRSPTLNPLFSFAGVSSSGSTSSASTSSTSASTSSASISSASISSASISSASSSPASSINFLLRSAILYPFAPLATPGLVPFILSNILSAKSSSTALTSPLGNIIILPSSLSV